MDMDTPTDNIDNRIPFSFERMVSMYEVNKDNFFECTIANFKRVTDSNFEFIPDLITKSGSEYMYTEEGVYRKSDHWNNKIALCSWLLDGYKSYENVIAYCSFEDFKAYDIPDEIIRTLLSTTKYKRKKKRLLNRHRGIINDCINKQFITQDTIDRLYLVVK